MMRSAILAAARSPQLEQLVSAAPVSRSVVRRFVAGTTTGEAIETTRELVHDGLAVTLDFLGEDTEDAAQAKAATAAYVEVLGALAAASLTPPAEVSVKLTALGLLLDEKLATDNVLAICRAADAAGTTVTVDMEDHTTTDRTLEIVRRVRKDHPDTGVVLQAYLHRTESDCRELAAAGSRVRLCKGAYNEPEDVAFQTDLEVSRSYVRCANVLLAGGGYPMFATHDPRLVAIVEDRVRWHDRDVASFEFQMLYGVRPMEQRRLAELGYAVRVYVPYGTQWYGYLMRRLAERPANTALFLRALVGRK
ncbi:proline dehydrogenase family protein [Fodinicola acaciae]|uniref:proline dehydrogenase family protein n=1 Tax=Fodinicola acaciae TaxID=2681555 RepID=UPI0013D3B2C8|nr:proline dehydrogenase family protein [Fodinicola acaciae]